MNKCAWCNSVSNTAHHEGVQESEFGNFQDTYDWIECESISHPGKKYFFNLRTKCSTWIRPVPNHVKLHFYSTKTRIYNNNFASDLDSLLMVVSSGTEDDNDYSEDNDSASEGAKTKPYKKRDRKNLEILWRLYYGANTDLCAMYDYFESQYQFPLEHPGASLGENSPVSMVEQSMNNDIREKSVGYKTSCEENKENSTIENSSVPRLQEIKPRCLSKKKIFNQTRKKVTNTEKPTTKRKLKATNEQNPMKNRKLKITPIIHEMYGIRSISYNPAEPEVPPGVKITNLSDTSVSSAMCYAEKSKSDIPISFELPNVNFNVDLSSSSSSSTCSSCSCSCSCSSTSSDTNSTSSETTNTSERG